MTIQSVITPAINGNGAVTQTLSGKTHRPVKAKAKKLDPVANTITREDAITAAFEYGSSMAGLDGNLTVAIKAFTNDETVLGAMLEALELGYLMRKLGVDKAEAARIAGLKKYNEDKQNDDHRTFEQERIMVAVRVLWSRAKKMAGVAKAETQVKAEATRAAKEAEKQAHEARLVKADEIVNPKPETDPFDALTQVVLTLKALQNKYSDKLVGERGSAWRDWLANAPK